MTSWNDGDAEIAKLRASASPGRKASWSYGDPEIAALKAAIPAERGPSWNDGDDDIAKIRPLHESKSSKPSESRTARLSTTVELPLDGRGTTYILSAMGHGKSVLLEHMILADVAQKRTTVVVDPHGDLALSILRQLPEDALPRVVWLDAKDIEHPFGLPLFYCADRDDQTVRDLTVSRILNVFRSRWGTDGTRGTSWGPQTEQVLRNLAHVAIDSPKALQLDTVPRFLDDQAFRQGLLDRATGYTSRYFWEKTYAFARGNSLENFRNPTVNKIDEFLGSRTVTNIVAQRKPSLDVPRLLDTPGTIVIVQAQSGIIGDDAASLVGSQVLSAVYYAALGRQGQRDPDRNPVHVYIDEVGSVASADLPEIITQLRKYKIALHLAHQVRSDKQMPRPLADATLLAENVFLGRLTPYDARVLSQIFRNPPPPGKSVTRSKMYMGPHGPEQDFYYDRASMTRHSLVDIEEGNQRNYSDMQLERADKLTSLHKFRWMYKMQDGESFVQGTLKSLPSARPASAILSEEEERRLAFVVDLAHQKYTRSRKYVEAQIEARRNHDVYAKAEQYLQAVATPNKPKRTAPVIDVVAEPVRQPRVGRARD